MDDDSRVQPTAGGAFEMPIAMAKLPLAKDKRSKRTHNGQEKGGVQKKKL